MIYIANTVGILEILYIYVFSKMDWKKKSTNKKSDINKNSKKKSR